MAQRRVARTVQGMDTSEGAGVRRRRAIGGPDLDRLDPFLPLDELESDDRRRQAASTATDAAGAGCGAPGRPLDSGR